MQKEKDQELDSVLESLELEGRLEKSGDTVTVRPETEVRLVESDEEELLERLPRVRHEASAEEFPEVELRDTIGEGGTAHVLAAEQVPLGREVAVKRIREGSDGTDQIKKLLQEAWVTGLLEHPNIVPIYRLGCDDWNEPVILMKRIEGMAWSEVLDEPDKAPSDFDDQDPLGWHLDVLLDVCNAVRYAHARGILHRDLKPENVMIGEFGEVYVVDWGMAVSRTSAHQNLPSASEVSSPAGTPAYMAPEMVAGEGDKLGPWTDVYQLGAILHHVLVGDPPHEGGATFEVLENAYRSEEQAYPESVPAGLAAICNKAMARQPKERYESVEDFQQALRDFEETRQARQIAEMAFEQLQTLREELDGEDVSEEGELREQFGECRFGFEQALEADPGNERARRGLQECLELMIEFELDRDGYQAASMMLQDLPEPAPELRERVEQLGDELEAREEDLEKFEKMQREADTDIARHTRSIVVLFLGVLWAAVGVWPEVVDTFFNADPGWRSYLSQATIVAGCIGGVLYFGRTDLFKNRANRQMVAGLVIIFVIEFIVRSIGSAGGLSVPTVMTQEMMMTAMGLSLMAISIDRRLFWAVSPYLIGSAIGATYPDFVYITNGLVNITAMSLLAWAWWPGDDMSEEEAEGV